MTESAHQPLSEPTGADITDLHIGAAELLQSVAGEQVGAVALRLIKPRDQAIVQSRLADERSRVLNGIHEPAESEATISLVDQQRDELGAIDPDVLGQATLGDIQSELLASFERGEITGTQLDEAYQTAVDAFRNRP